jgi:hypothetical protein
MPRPIDRQNRRGDPVKADLYNEIRWQMRRQRVHVAGAQQVQGAGGTAIHVPAGTADLTPIRTTSAISGRSGATPGTGTAMLLGFDGTDLVDKVEVTLYNVSLAAGGSGLYGLAGTAGGEWFLVGLECD